MWLYKRCTKCNQEKLLTAFNKFSGARDGLQYWCKDCMRLHSIQSASKRDYGYKVCTSCHQRKRLQEFHCFTLKQKRYASTCKECDEQQGRNYSPQTQECIECRKLKSLDDFYKNERLGTVFTRCKECISIAYKGNYQKHRKKRVRIYGLTEDHYMQMLEEQGGVCAICHQPETKMTNGKVHALAIDHCHTTDAVRGLLCTNCNTALSLLGENPDRIERLIKYIEERCI